MNDSQQEHELNQNFDNLMEGTPQYEERKRDLQQILL